jgi:hypothetical protein
MKKKFGVCFGIVAMGLAVIGAPVSRAAGGSGGESETTTVSTSAPTAASSPADLDRRIEALEMELSELRTELTAKKEADAAAASATPAAVEGVTIAAQDAAKPPEKTTIASLLGPTSLSGFVDTYWNWDYNHPASHAIQACSFDCRTNSLSLNMIELILDKAPDPMGGAAGRTGYHFSVGYGDTQVAINNAEFASSGTVNTLSPGGPGSLAGFDQYIKEAYFSYLAPVGSGLQVDVGKFVTPLGAEVIESKDNWNYSRGLLFNYAIPLNHFGMRAKYTFNSKFNVTGYLVNGFNNVVDNNSGKTFGISNVWTPNAKNTLTVNYFAGPESPTSEFPASSGFTANQFWRQTWDLVYQTNLTSKLTFLANYDYVFGDRLILNTETTPWTLSKPIHYTGGAGYLKYAFDDKDYVAGRYEYVYDKEGFIGGFPHAHLQEFTATYQRTLATHLLTRFEYRRDMSGLPFFPVGHFTSESSLAKHQDLFTIGLIFLFDSRDAK